MSATATSEVPRAERVDIPAAADTRAAPASTSAVNNHEATTEEREAFEYWGYLFKADKTGTDKLKGLLRGLKNVMNEVYDVSDSADLTPAQLASFYRDLHGNYDQLFLGTPGASIAFIYKSLGCLYSLQPLSHSTAFTEPTVPALKTEGWIMWQTIQLLLGPDEHSTFLVEAVRRWDVKDPVTGTVFPKLLPRRCFPLEPDKHMVAWYEGVSDRLRREAEDEETQRVRIREPEAERMHHQHLTVKDADGDTDDEGSVDSRGPALAYFRNPLYRHVDGRPSILRRSSKRPPLSPKQSMIGKGKEAASTIGHVVRNVASPHLWDGHGHASDHSRGHSHSHSHSHSRGASRDRDRRRRSQPENAYHYPGDPVPPPTDEGYDGRRLSVGHAHRHRHRPSPSEVDQEAWDADSSPSPLYSPESSPAGRTRPSPGHHSRHKEALENRLRHARSHEPTASPREDESYFPPDDISTAQRRRASAYDDTIRPGSTTGTPSAAPSTGAPVGSQPSGIGAGFMPSSTPLFASTVANQPRASPPHRFSQPPSFPPPGPGTRYDSPLRHSTGPSPAPNSSRASYGITPPPARSTPYDHPPPVGYNDDGPATSSLGRVPSRRSDGRRSTVGTDPEGWNSADDRRGGRTGDGGRQKTARFASPKAVKGVDGRRYPNEAPWR